MEKTNLQTGEAVVREAPFWSGVEVNLEATNLDELYEKWKWMGLQVYCIFRDSHGKIRTHERLHFQNI